MSERMQIRSARPIARLAALAGLIAIAAFAAAPSNASAASCPKVPATETTTWIGGAGDFSEDGAWSNGTPTGSCHVIVTPAGSPTITMTGGFNTKSLTLGGSGSTPQLVISALSPNTNLDAQPGGITIAQGASITLTCPSPATCLGGSSGGAGLVTGASPLANAGTIKVDANSGTGASVSGAIDNTGTMTFEKTASLGGVVVNKGAIDISTGATVTNSGSSCGDTGASVKNDTGGTITANGTGILSVVNYEQGNGSVGGTSSAPINIPCGSLKYSGSGTSKVQATGGFDLSGTEMGSSQSLVVLAQSSNTNATLKGNFTNKGSITLSCLPPGGPPPPVTGCSGGDAGGAGFNVNDKDFVNSGTFTVAAASGTGASVGANFEGSITNTGTMQFDQTAGLNGPVTNQGAINIADGKSVTSGGGCGSGTSVKNDTGGSINATGSGTGALFVSDYEQGNGTTTGAIPVQMGGGCLKYTGNGASKVKVVGGFTLTGEMQPGQSLTVSAEGAPNVNATLGGNFTNKGSITLTCTPACGASGGVGFNVNDKDFVNSGTFTVAAASGTGASVGANFEGSITNTGTMQFDQTAGLNGPVTNQGAINIADGKSVTSGGGCGSGTSVKNDTGGSINATGSGTGALFVGDYEQGNGTTTGAIPVQLYGGCLKYTGAAGVGASKVLAYAGFNLTGEMQAAQSLTVTNASPNTNLVLQSPFTSKGSITFTCPTSPCNGPGFNGNGHPFTNAGTFTVDAAASSGTTLDMSSGGMTNSPTGIFQLNGHTNFNGGGPFANQGTLRIVASANTPSFPNSGTVVLDQSATSPTLNTSTLTNTGTIATDGAAANTSSLNGTVDQTGASAQVIVPAGTKLSLANPLLLKAGKLTGGGTLTGSVNNSGGTVAPGASPGTLTLSGNYTQGSGGTLAIEIEGTGANQFDKLAVGGNATLGGALSLQPSAAYVASAAAGDNVGFLAYGGTRTDKFASTSVSLPPKCQDAFAIAYDDGAKKVSFAVSASGAACTQPDPQTPTPTTTTPPPTPPNTVLGTHPKSKVKTRKGKASVKFAFSASVPGATFECKLDNGAYASCASPKSYKVKPGKHTFSVRAVGAGGTDSTPASFGFKVVKQKPKSKK